MIRAMLIKECILVLRDRHALAALFIMPAVFILIMSLALKDTLNSDRVVLHYAILDQDKSPQSAKLRNLMHESSGLQEHDLILSTPLQQQRALNETVQFILSIPKGFARNITRKQNKNPLLQIDAAGDVQQVMLSVFQANLAADIMRLRIDSLQEKLAPIFPETAQHLTAMNFSTDKLVTVHYNGLAADKQPTSTQQSVPSWIVFGMFFVIIPMSTIFINERKQNTLMRMSAMNISVPALFAGKIAPYILINQIQVWLMIAVGIFLVPLFGGDALTLGNSVIGLVMVSLGLSLAAIGTSVCIAVLSKTVEQATTIGGIINILMGAIGGIMVPKFYMPHSMQELANISPMSWGLDGFLDIFLRGLGAEAVVRESLTLAAFGIVLLLLAGTLLNSQLRRGI